MAYGASVGAVDPFAITTKPRTLKSVYDSAATEQAQNYDDIMRGYDSILSDTRSRSGQNKLNYVPINPVFSQYTPTTYNRTGELNTALTGLSDYSRTGGYSDADVNAIRERSISPIRALYANAQNNLRRKQILQGGNSSNYGALTAKMARDLSTSIGDTTTKVNADIAQMIASGKLSGLNSLASTAGTENALRANIASQNAENAMRTNESNVNEARRVEELNRTLPLNYGSYNQNIDNSNVDDQLKALSGKTNLYGTTPALTSTFANQVLQNNAQNMQAVTTANQLKNQRTNIGMNLYQAGLPGVAGRGRV